jgi:hypothetical protein
VGAVALAALALKVVGKIHQGDSFRGGGRSWSGF